MAKIRLKDATIRLIAPNNDPSDSQTTFATPGAIGNFGRCDLTIGDGTLTWTENRAVEYVLDRGSIFYATQNPSDSNYNKVAGYVRFGDETPMDVSFDFIFDYYAIFGTTTGANDYGPIELLKGAESFGNTANTRRPFRKATTVTPYSIDNVLQTAAPTGLGYTTFSDGVVPVEAYLDLCAPYCLDVLISFEKTCTGTDNVEHYLFKYFRYTSLDYDLSTGQISVAGQCQRALAKHFSV